MHAITRVTCGSAAVLAIVVSMAQGPDSRIAAAPHGTPVASGCANFVSGGTPIASPAAESATPEPTTLEFVVDRADLIEALEAQGANVVESGSLEQPFFNAIRSDRLMISGEFLSTSFEVQVYEYADAEALAADASQVTADGNLQTVMIEWIAPPHFFCGERVMVIYLGDEQVAIDLLTSVLGPQFAGR